VEKRYISPRQIRRIILDQPTRSHVGHIGSALSIAEIMAALYAHVLRIPEREECERLFCPNPARFIAAQVTAGGTVVPEVALAHTRVLGLAGAVLDTRTVEAALRAGMRASEGACGLGC